MMQTLPDYLRGDLPIVSIGLNPSLNSVKAGFYFSTPSNRFWKALNASAWLDHALEPGIGAVECLFERYAMGFTDVVKHPTAGAAQLRAAHYRRYAPELLEKLQHYQPAVAWFHGKVAYTQFLNYALGRREACDWGAQALRIGRSRVFVTPNTSAANAAFSLQELTRWFVQVREYAGTHIG